MTKPAVRSFAKGLRVLRLLSTVDGRSINDVARELQLPRATCHRLLKTLEHEGYAALSKGDNRYRLTEDASHLGRSDGWTPSVSEVVQPFLDRFTVSHLWPVALSVLRGHQMMSRATSEASSPFSLEHYKPGYLMSLTRSSPGQVFLAYSPPRLRKVLFDNLYASETAASDLTPSQLRKRLESIRRDGFAFSTIRFAGEHAYAIPVFVEKQLHSALSIRYVASAFSADGILDETLAPLRALSNEISTALETSPVATALSSR